MLLQIQNQSVILMRRKWYKIGVPYCLHIRACCNLTLLLCFVEIVTTEIPDMEPGQPMCSSTQISSESSEEEEMEVQKWRGERFLRKTFLNEVCITIHYSYALCI